MEKNNLGDLLKKLEKNVEWFESQDEIDVEKGLEKVKEGIKLIKMSKERFRNIENEFREIKKELNETDDIGLDPSIKQ
ncbi:MAG: exodeoxyribonuclease VII small subunit [Minisyncoccia bacterium]